MHESDAWLVRWRAFYTQGQYFRETTVLVVLALAGKGKQLRLNRAGWRARRDKEHACE